MVWRAKQSKPSVGQPQPVTAFVDRCYGVKGETKHQWTSHSHGWPFVDRCYGVKDEPKRNKPSVGQIQPRVAFAELWSEGRQKRNKPSVGQIQPRVAFAELWSEGRQTKTSLRWNVRLSAGCDGPRKEIFNTSRSPIRECKMLVVWRAKEASILPFSRKLHVTTRQEWVVHKWQQKVFFFGGGGGGGRQEPGKQAAFVGSSSSVI